MDIADEETPSQVEPQPEEVPELHKVENEEVAAEQPCLDKKPPVAEAAPGPASEMDEDLKDGDAVPVLDEEVPDSGEAEAGPETPAEIKYPQHEALPVDEPSHGDEVPVTSLPESETFPEMENTTAEEEVSGESVAPALEPELEDTTDIPHSSFEETSEPVEEGEEVHQPSVEHETVPKVEHANETSPEPEPKENIQQEAPVEHEPLAPEEELANEASADPQPVHELEPPAAPTVVETRVQDEEPHTESGTTEEISPEEQPVEPEATAQDEETAKETTPEPVEEIPTGTEINETPADRQPTETFADDQSNAEGAEVVEPQVKAAEDHPPEPEASVELPEPDEIPPVEHPESAVPDESHESVDDEGTNESPAEIDRESAHEEAPQDESFAEPSVEERHHEEAVTEESCFEETPPPVERDFEPESTIHEQETEVEPEVEHEAEPEVEPAAEHETAIEPVAQGVDAGLETTYEAEEPTVEEDVERAVPEPLEEQTDTTAVDSEPTTIIESDETHIPEQPPASDEEAARVPAEDEIPQTADETAAEEIPVAQETSQVEESHDSGAAESEQPIDLNSYEQAEVHEDSEPEIKDPEPSIDLGASPSPPEEEPAATEAEPIDKYIETAPSEEVHPVDLEAEDVTPISHEGEPPMDEAPEPTASPHENPEATLPVEHEEIAHEESEPTADSSFEEPQSVCDIPIQDDDPLSTTLEDAAETGDLESFQEEERKPELSPSADETDVPPDNGSESSPIEQSGTIGVEAQEDLQPIEKEPILPPEEVESVQEREKEAEMPTDATESSLPTTEAVAEPEEHVSHDEPAADLSVAAVVAASIPLADDVAHMPSETGEETPEPTNDDEFIMISRDEAPMEDAEEYPSIQMQNSDIFHAPAMEKEVSLDDLALHYPIIEEPEPIEESESTTTVVDHAPLEPNDIDPEAVVEAKSGEPEENEPTPSTLTDDTEPKSVHFAEDVAHVPAELDEQPHEPPCEEPISALNPVDESAEPDSISVPEAGFELSTASHEVPSEDAPPESEPIVHAQKNPEAPMEEVEQQPHESSEDTISPPTLEEISQPREMEEDIPHSAPAEFDEPDDPSEEQQQDVAAREGVSEPTIERFEEEKEASEEHHIDTGDIQNLEPEPEPEVVADSEVTAPGEDTEEAAPPTVVLGPVADDVAPVESREIDEVPGDVEHSEEETQPLKAVEPEVDDVPPVESHEVEETPAETEQADVAPTGQDAPELKAEPAATPEALHLEEAKEGHSFGYLAAAGAIIAGGAAVENFHAEEASAPVSPESREADEPLKEEPATVEEHVHNEEVHGLEDGITPGEPATEQVPVQETEPPTKDVEIEQIPDIREILETPSEESPKEEITPSQLPADKVESEVPLDREIPVEILEETAQRPSDEVSHADDVADEKPLEPHSPSEIATVDLADEPPATEQAGEGAETPVGTLLQGTLAPPSTPFVPKSVPEVPSGLIAASVHSLSTEKLDHFAPVEMDEIHQHDVPEIPHVSVPAEDTQVEEAEVPPLEGVPIQEVEQKETTEVPSEEYQAAEPEEAVKGPVQIGGDTSNSVEEEVDGISKGKNESHPVLEEAAVITSIPAVLTAGTIGLVATATQHKESHPDLTDTEHSTRLINIMSPDIPSLAIEGPFVEPLKHHVQPEEILELPSDQDTDNLTSRFVPLPCAPTRLPNGRPSTSYSWLGHLFQPISPEIIEAEQNGWVAVPEVDDKPAHADKPVRRHSSRLKRRLKRLSRVQEQDENDQKGCKVM